MNEDNGEEKQFEKIGEKGNSSSSGKARQVCMSRWFGFLKDKNISFTMSGYKFSSHVNEETIIDLFQEYAGYLFILKKSDGNFYKRASILNYLGGVKELMMAENRHWKVWSNYMSDPFTMAIGWFSKIKLELIKKINARLIETGDQLQNKAPPMGRILTKDVIEALMKLDVFPPIR